MHIPLKTPSTSSNVLIQSNFGTKGKSIDTNKENAHAAAKNPDRDKQKTDLLNKPNSPDKTKALNRLSVEQLNKLPAEKLNKLNRAQLNKLNPAQLNKLNLTQLQKLSPVNVEKLNAAQKRKLELVKNNEDKVTISDKARQIQFADPKAKSNKAEPVNTIAALEKVTKAPPLPDTDVKSRLMAKPLKTFEHVDNPRQSQNR